MYCKMLSYYSPETIIGVDCRPDFVRLDHKMSSYYYCLSLPPLQVHLLLHPQDIGKTLQCNFRSAAAAAHHHIIGSDSVQTSRYMQ